MEVLSQMVIPLDINLGILISFLFQDSVKAHLPDPSTFNGIVDILTLAILMELGNVVSFWCYQEAESSESLHERGRMIHTRACARELVDWVFANFELYDTLSPGGGPINGKVAMYWRYLVHQARLLVAYKQQAFDNGMNWNGPGRCLPDDVKSAVERYFAHDPNVHKMYREAVQKKPKDTSFGWPGPTYAVQIRSSPAPLEGSHTLSHFQPLTAHLCCRILPWLHSRRFKIHWPPKTSSSRPRYGIFISASNLNCAHVCNR